MDLSSLDYTLTELERLTFKEQGYLILEDALPPDVCDDLETAADKVGEAERSARDLSPYDRLSVMDFIGRDDRFLELVDWPRVLPKVWGLMGWNIQIYHSHLVYSPPEEPGNVSPAKRGWHQDSGRPNIEMESNPRPMLSLKVCYFLSDCSHDGMANFYVVPGSHLKNDLISRDQRKVDPEEATPVLVPRGTAVFFDRRIWHTASPNGSQVTRKALFYGYSFRWLRPRDNMTVKHYFDRIDPIRKQLLGHNVTEKGYSSPMPEDVPLKAWIEEHQGAGAIAEWE